MKKDEADAWGREQNVLTRRWGRDKKRGEAGLGVSTGRGLSINTGPLISGNLRGDGTYSTTSLCTF